jgi:hypothetical protein
MKAFDALKNLLRSGFEVGELVATVDRLRNSMSAAVARPLQEMLSMHGSLR